MKPIVLLDHQRFDEFLENQEIDAFVITPAYNQANLKINNVVEVRHKATSKSRYGYYLAVIVGILGSFDRDVLKVRIQKMGNWN